MNIGGQAVVEGVLMRSTEKVAIAVRLPNGKIRVKKENLAPIPKIGNAFFVRGIVRLWHMLKDGMKALIWSSNQQLDEKEKLTTAEFALTLLGSLVFAAVIFVGVPFFSARLIQEEGLGFNILEGVLRIMLFIIYILAISRMKDVQVLFQYHGAEHKTIYCYEAKKKIAPGAIQKFPKEHHRCGTSFIFIVLIVSVFLFSLISGPWWMKLVGRIVLLPVVAGISYEIIKLGDKFHHTLPVKILLAPGIWLQKITTREPNKKQIEVAMKSLKGVV
jgi:uncharacterized protein YqhQ